MGLKDVLESFRQEGGAEGFFGILQGRPGGAEGFFLNPSGQAGWD